MSANEQTPGLIGSHATYAKGAAVEAIGSLTGSEAWKSSGVEQKEAGISDMRAATKARENDPTQHGLGNVEKMAGQAVGCEGMEKEGQQSASS